MPKSLLPVRHFIYVSRSPNQELMQEISRNRWKATPTRCTSEIKNIVSESPLCVGLIELGDSPDELQFLQRVIESTACELKWIALVSPSLISNRDAASIVTQYCYDFHTKPVDIERLVVTLGRGYGMAKTQLSSTQQQICAHKDYGIFGRSPAIQALRHDIVKMAATDLPVLITGETGTGKELAARAIHSCSARKDGPFIAVNCAAIPASLIQAELFGHERGAFTGAIRRNTGKLEAANKGTIFLDEIGDLPVEHQVNLLRVLQEHRIQRLGGTPEIELDIRTIAATNVNVERAVKEHLFREDLYYRLNVLRLRLPPLRERPGDIELLAKHFFNRFSDFKKPFVKGFSKSAIDAMRQYSWPGNVRELQNRVRRAMIEVDGWLISETDLCLADVGVCTDLLTLSQARALAEKKVIEAALKYTEFNCSATARKLQVTRTTLYRLIDKHQIRIHYDERLHSVPNNPGSVSMQANLDVLNL